VVEQLSASLLQVFSGVLVGIDLWYMWQFYVEYHGNERL